MILHLKNINSNNLQSFESQIILNKDLTNISTSNMYEILFDSQSFGNIFNTVLQKLKEITNENFSVYVKNMWGFIQTESKNEPLYLTYHLKDELSIKPKYTFIYVIKCVETILQVNNEKIVMKDGDLIIFDSKNTVEDKSIDTNKIILIGSISNDLYECKNEKKLL